MTNIAPVTAEDSDEEEVTERGKVVKPNNMMKEPSIDAGMGLATGAVFLGEGMMLETNQIFEPRTMLSFDLGIHSHGIESLGFASVELDRSNRSTQYNQCIDVHSFSHGG